MLYVYTMCPPVVLDGGQNTNVFLLHHTSYSSFRSKGFCTKDCWPLTIVLVMWPPHKESSWYLISLSLGSWHKGIYYTEPGSSVGTSCRRCFVLFSGSIVLLSGTPPDLFRSMFGQELSVTSSLSSYSLFYLS